MVGWRARLGVVFGAAFLSAAWLSSSASGLVVSDSKVGSLAFSGQACGSTATRSMKLPKAAHHLRVVHPKAGEAVHDAATSTVEVATVAAVTIRNHREVVTVRGSGDVCSHPEKYPNGWHTDDVLL